MPLVSSLFSWVRGDDGEPVKLSASLRASLEVCEREQERIARDIEALLHSYHERSTEVSRRLVRARKEGIRQKELGRLREEQEKLILVIRRLQASERTLQDLEYEYREWRARAREGGEDEREILKRAEIIASELRVRGREIEDPEQAVYTGSAKDADPFADLVLTDTGTDSVLLEMNDDGLEVAPPGGDHCLPGLLEEVDVAASEARRLLRASDGQDASAIASALADLRRHHANLRMHDRRHGIRRIRVEL